MNRRNLLALCILFAGCGGGTKTITEILPASLPGGFARGAVEKSADVPALVSQLGLAESATVTYGSSKVRVFRMRSETSAFELVQKWRPSEGVATYKGPFFFVADGPDAVAVLRELAKALAQ